MTYAETCARDAGTASNQLFWALVDGDWRPATDREVSDDGD
jgi:hypothetical protein